MELDKFEEFLSQGNMAKNTISAYLYAVKEFGSRHKELNKRNLLVYKTYLIETYKPKTVNLRIQAMNKYLVFVGKTKLRLKSVKVQQRSYLENVISNADYTFLKNKLKKEDNLEWYFVVRFLAATGARVSELVQIKVEHVQVGYYDIYTKGGKIRKSRLSTCKLAITTSTPRVARYGVSISPRHCARKQKNGCRHSTVQVAISFSIALASASRQEAYHSS